MDSAFCMFLFAPSNLAAFLVQNIRFNVSGSKMEEMEEMEDRFQTADPGHEGHVQSHSFVGVS